MEFTVCKLPELEGTALVYCKQPRLEGQNKNSNEVGMMETKIREKESPSTLLLWTHYSNRIDL